MMDLTLFSFNNVFIFNGSLTSIDLGYVQEG